MRYLKVIGSYINIDQTIYFSIDPGEEGKVLFNWKDTNGTVHTQTLVRKDTFIADPLTVDEIRRATYRALATFSDNVHIVDLTDHLDKDEDEEDEE